ncbi:MAG TPA: prepilin peptidase [Sporichthyaceae bacterium]|nr:prepilin peptidase [Sporichthyaceae bacterium]
MRPPESTLVPALMVLGLVIGSFLNVAIQRVPRGLSINSPGSACPSCGHPVRWFDNVPVLSWLVLRARCRDCRAPVSIRYPLVEAATAGLFALLGMRFGWSWLLPAMTVLIAGCVALALIDLDVGRLPFAITVPGLPVVAALLALAGYHDGWHPARVAVVSMLVWLGLFGFLHVGTGGRGMGLGDVVLAPTLGLALGWLGWGASLIGLFGGFAAGAVTGLLLIAFGGATRKTAIPFGPFMVIGATLGLFFGNHLWHIYLSGHQFGR